MSQSKISINGPINYIKLQNKEKEVHLFFDYHEELEYQQKCDSFDSVDINNFIAQVLLRTDNDIDFFAEIFKKQLKTDYEFNVNDIYIMNVRKMFNNIYNKKEKKNIRLHYIDIRDYNSFIKHGVNTIPDIVTNIIDNEQTVDDNTEIIIQQLQQVQSDMERLLKYSNHILEKNKEKFVLNKKHQEYYHLLEKMLIRYNDNNIKDKLQELYIKFCLKPFEKVIELIKETTKLLDREYNKYLKWGDNKKPIIIEKEKDGFIYNNMYEYPQMSKETYNKIVENIKDIEGLYDEAICLIMDTYFLRRLLDKTYVKKSIVFTGGDHCRNYLWILVKYFNFEINTIFFVRDYSKEEFEKYIHTVKNPVLLDKVLRPDGLKQCITINEI